MRLGLYVLGDELLSGRRTDRHLAQVIAILSTRGLRLAWAQFLGDDRAALEAAFRRSLDTSDVVFSCGGIGATPDDHTRQACAAALGVELELHPEARLLIAQAVARRGVHDLASAEGRRILQMGEFPRGSRLIPNSYNGIPGFSVGDHHFVPGFPVMAWPMIEWVLDTQYARHFHQQPHAERSLRVFDLRESTITPLLIEIESRFAAVGSFSLPSVGDGTDGLPARRHIELGVKGDPVQVEAAYAFLRLRLQEMGAAIEDLPAGPAATASTQ